MATVAKESIGILHEKLVVTLTPEDYIDNFNKKLKSYAKNANIPGFRKGMVPIGLVKKMYGNGVFQEEVIKTVEEKLFDYLKTEQLDIFAQPLPLDFDINSIDMNNPTAVSMPFEVGVKPSFDINTTNINAKSYQIDITDSMITEEVNRLTSRFGVMFDAEEVNNAENILNLTFNEIDEAQVAVEGGIEKTNSVLVKYFTESYASTLMGKKVNDTFTVKLGDAFGEKEIDAILSDLGLQNTDEDKNLQFLVTITKVGGVTLAEINEELFKAAFPNAEIKDEEGFRNEIKAEIERAFKPQAKNQLYDQIYHSLLDNTSIELPQAFLTKWLQVGGEKKKSEEEAIEEFPEFAKSLKWTIITDKLAKDNDIKVEKEDIKLYAKSQIMGYMNMSVLDDSQPWIEDYANRMMNDKKFVEESFYKIQSEKMFDAVANQINITNTTVTVEEFNNIGREHKH